MSYALALYLLNDSTREWLEPVILKAPSRAAQRRLATNLLREDRIHPGVRHLALMGLLRLTVEQTERLRRVSVQKYFTT